MSRRYQRMTIVSCGNCGANYDARGSNPRCPACNARLADYEAGEPRPAVRGYEIDLEGPDLLRRPEEEESETAPPEDFVAAGLVLLSFIFIVAAIFLASPLLLNAGLATFALAGIGFGLYKLRKRLKYGGQSRDDRYGAPSMFDWLIGRGFWDRFR